MGDETLGAHVVLGVCGEAHKRQEDPCSGESEAVWHASILLNVFGRGLALCGTTGFDCSGSIAQHLSYD